MAREPHKIGNKKAPGASPGALVVNYGQCGHLTVWNPLGVPPWLCRRHCVPTSRWQAIPPPRATTASVAVLGQFNQGHNWIKSVDSETEGAGLRLITALWFFRWMVSWPGPCIRGRWYVVLWFFSLGGGGPVIPGIFGQHMTDQAIPGQTLVVMDVSQPGHQVVR